MTHDNTTSTITTVRLQRLIRELYEHSPDNRVRFRIIGQMWETGFLKIVHVAASNSVVVQDEKQMKHVSIGDVVEFEVETKFQEFVPLNHYKVEFH